METEQDKLNELQRRVIENAINAADPNGIPNVVETSAWIAALHELLDAKKLAWDLI